MGSSQLAIVFGPALCWSSNSADSLAFSGHINNMVKWLIDHQERIFDQSWFSTFSSSSSVTNSRPDRNLDKLLNSFLHSLSFFYGSLQINRFYTHTFIPEVLNYRCSQNGRFVALRSGRLQRAHASTAHQTRVPKWTQGEFESANPASGAEWRISARSIAAGFLFHGRQNRRQSYCAVFEP